ncbi:MAG: hypothetical protein Q4F23_02420, partial [Coriobacteriia bacterium]|nr:hypothetical protein [Coriobacteriia bacterium]
KVRLVFLTSPENHINQDVPGGKSPQPRHDLYHYWKENSSISFRLLVALRIGKFKKTSKKKP